MNNQLSAMPWYEAINYCHANGIAYVLITIISEQGSAPRNAGTKMVITGDRCFDTIGGGNLEHKVTHNARNHLINKEINPIFEAFPLSAKTAQCCGGKVEILYEVHNTHCQHLALFGAGHVANALVPIVSQLTLQITWYESREEYLNTRTTENVKPTLYDCPKAAVKAMPSDSWTIVMTHNHQLDFDLVAASLKRPDIPYVGMIGSDTKVKRFNYRLSQHGINPEQLQRFVAPIGELSIPGKKPIEVAISISAQLVQMLNQVKCEMEPSVKHNYQPKEVLHDA